MTIPTITPSGMNIKVRDQFVRSAPLGLHFEDATLAGRVRDGLHVTATHEATGVTEVARRGSSGVYGFTDLPTTSADQLGPVEDFRPPTPYLIDVHDRLGRFLALRTIEVAPAAFRSDQPIFLYPAPSRPTPPSFIAIRASIRIEDPAKPVESGMRWRAAAYAKLEIVADSGVVTTGFADRSGATLVLVPLAESTPGVALNDQRVELTLQTFYDPELELPAGGPPRFELLDAQPSRAHLAGPDLAADGTFSAGLAESAVLKSTPPTPSSSDSFLLLQTL